MSSPTGAMIPKASISGYKQRSVPQFTGDQMKLFQMLLGNLMGGGGLSGGMDFLSKLASGGEGAFKDIEEPAFRQLQGQLGQIGNRFADIGALGSSGFQQMASGATADLASRLQSERLGLQQGAIERLLGLSQNLLGQRPYDTFLEKKRSGWDTAGDITGMIAKFLPFFL